MMVAFKYQSNRRGQIDAYGDRDAAWSRAANNGSVTDPGYVPALGPRSL
jgi:hypothetical protein